MGGAMRVDADALVALAAALAAAADAVSGGDPAAPVGAAAAALPGSDSAAALAPFPAALTRAVADAAQRLRAMSDAATGSATGYGGTEDAAVARLERRHR